MSPKYIYKIGRRKTSVATVRLFEGKGSSEYNGKPIEKVYISKVAQSRLKEPFTVAGLDFDNFHFTAKVTGGGTSSQLQAIILGLSRAITQKYPEVRKQLKLKGLLTRDPRMVERKKTGRHKARKSEQYSKR